MLNCLDGMVCEPRKKLTQSEKYLYKIWLEKEFSMEHLQTISGKTISIISPGIRNESEGPDFLNAMIMINDDLLSGDIEIHLKNKDWYLHQHEKDENYNNVVLHVIKEASDVDFIENLDGKKIDVLQLPLGDALASFEPFPCKKWTPLNFEKFEKIIIDYSAKRFRRKTLAARKSLLQYQPEQYFFIGMLDVMGYSKNRIAMKQIAKVLDIEKLYQLLNTIDEDKRLLFLETVFLGIAGLLDDKYEKYYSSPAYFEALQQQWKKLAEQHEFESIRDQKFHFAGSRPANYPHKRLVALAQIINNIYPQKPGQLSMELLFSGRKFEVILQMLKEKFQLPSGMWKNHPLFKTHKSNLLIGDSRLMDFLSNIMLPFARAFNSILKEDENVQYCIDINGKIPVGAMPGKIKDMLKYLQIPITQIKTNYLLQGCIEYHRLFCDLNLCSICILGDMVEHK